VVTKISLVGAKSLPIYFREWREHLGWSQEQLADRIGTTKQSVSRIERGIWKWHSAYLEAFAAVCNCPSPLDPISRPPHVELSLEARFRALPLLSQEQVLDLLEVVEKKMRKPS